MRYLSLLAAAMVLSAVNAWAAQFPSETVKWHPGHYVTLTSFASDGPGYFQAVLDEISRYPALRGIQKRYLWSDLEKTEGVYDFSEIESDLARLAEKKKRLVILLQTKSFNARTKAAPDYLAAAAYEGGTFDLEIKAGSAIASAAGSGTNIKLWNNNVRDRLIALVQALGDHFNEHPYLEAVAFTETAMGKSEEPVTEDQLRGYYANLLMVNREMKRAFPNTVTIQFVNFPRSILPTFVGSLADAGVGLGGPDIFLSDQSLINGVYTYYPKLSGIVPLAPSVQHENYYARRFRGPYDPPSVVELFHFAKNELRANYVFWTRRLVPPEKPYAKVLEMINSPSFPKDVAGGLDTTCPSAFSRCDSH